MQRKVPKNIRQIGYANENDKVYMEDYVDTYLNQLCDKADEHAEGAFLIGEQILEDGKRHTYIYGAVNMKEIEATDGKPEITDAAYQMAKEECMKYFEDGTILGWFLAADGYVSGIDANLLRQHEKYLDKPNTFLLLREPDSRDENFYIYRDHELQRLSGHYIYYEKNPSMQNYMIDQRRGVGIESQNVVIDEATQNLRQILQQKEKKRPDTGSLHRMSYALSTALVLVVLAMGIGAFNNYDGLSGLRGAIGVSSGKVNSRDGGKDAALENNNDSTGFADASSDNASSANTASNEASLGNTASDDASSADAASDDASSADSSSDNVSAANKASGNASSADMASDAASASNASSGAASSSNAASDNASSSNAASGAASSSKTGSDAATQANTASDAASSVNTASDASAAKTSSGASSGNYYTVKKGDTLASISRKMYGTTSKVKDICSANNISNVDLIIEGQKILLP